MFGCNADILQLDVVDIGMHKKIKLKSFDKKNEMNHQRIK
jgi:hypothetical protein